MKIFLCIFLGFALTACQGRALDFTVRFHELGSLRPGDRILVAGQEAGKVERIQRAEDGMWWVAVRIRSRFRDQVTTGSHFVLEADPDFQRRLCILVTPNPAGQPLPDGALVDGSEPMTGFLQPLVQGMGEGLQALQRQLGEFTRELERLPDSPGFRRLQRQLGDLARQMNEAEEKMQRDVLPRLQEEMERLQRELERRRPQGGEGSTPDTIDL